MIKKISLLFEASSSGRQLGTLVRCCRVRPGGGSRGDTPEGWGGLGCGGAGGGSRLHWR